MLTLVTFGPLATGFPPLS